MTATKTTGLSALTSVDGAADFLPIVDVSDTSMAASGTTKKVLPNNLPVSTAAQTALDLKANLASPTLTGTPAAPTASPGTNTTQLATTAFVTAAVGAVDVSGKVTGPASATDNAVMRFDATTGKLAQDSSVTISDAGQIVAAQGTITTSQPHTVTQTWNASGVAFNAMLVNVTNTASATASTLADWQVGGTSAAKFGKPGTNSTFAGSVTSPGLTLTSGVDTLQISADNQFRCSIVTTSGLVLYSGSCVSVGGPALGTTPSVGDPNGINLSRRGIILGRHSGQLTTGPTTMTTCHIKFEDQVNNDPIIPFEIVGNGCHSAATTNIVGGSVKIIGGAGATGSSGDAHGGAVYFVGGLGYGTGVSGNAILAHTGSGARGKVLIGTATADGSAAILQVAGSMSLTGAILPATLTNAAAPNSSLYYSSDAGKLVFKDSGGTVNNLY